MDLIIKESVKNCSNITTQLMGVDEEQQVYVFDHYDLNRFVKNIVSRCADLADNNARSNILNLAN